MIPTTDLPEPTLLTTGHAMAPATWTVKEVGVEHPCLHCMVQCLGINTINTLMMKILADKDSFIR